MRTLPATIALLLLSALAAFPQSPLQIAEETLVQHGASSAKLSLAITDETDELCVFEDSRNRMFAIIAKPPYYNNTREAVLAYSIEAALEGTESAWRRNLIAAYSEQLRMIAEIENHEKGRNMEADEHRSGMFHIGERTVEPLLRTRWGQGYPYNLLCPSVFTPSTHKPTGCVATALSQIMYFWGVNPDYASTQAATAFPFAKMHHRYSSMKVGKVDTAPVAELMYENAKALDSDFSGILTPASPLVARSVLVNTWGYSPECHFLHHRSLRTMLEIIGTELQEGRPVFATGGHHAFVCDGRRGAFWHLNLGWDGAANGYFRILLSPVIDDTAIHNTIIRNIIFGIRPDVPPSARLEKRVHVATAGTLSSLLTREEQRTLRSLTITGNLNGRDIALIRRMTGAMDAWRDECRGLTDSDERWSGVVRVLDLSGANIRGDQWHPFMRYTMEGKKRPLTLYTSSNVIKRMMFYDCQNLRHIILPKNIKKVEDDAFLWCYFELRIEN